jgi:phosphopantetheinyl transferase
VGIDIEKIRDRVVRVKDRFLCQDELESLDPDSNLEQLHIYWGGKEALYKLSGQPGVDFRNDIHIHPFDYLCHTKQNCTATITIGENRKEYTLFHMKIEEYMLVVAF